MGTRHLALVLALGFAAEAESQQLLVLNRGDSEATLVQLVSGEIDWRGAVGTE